MAISNLASGLRPGVCTSTTRPTTPFEGQMIYETDTNRVLVWDNAAWVMIADTDQPPGMQLITTSTFSAQTQVDFSDVFTSDYTNYRLVFDEWSSTVNENQLFRFRDSTGTISTTNYLTNRLEQVSTTVSGVAFGASSGFFPTYAVASGTAAANTAGYIDVFQPNVSGEYTRVNGTFTRSDSTTTLYSVVFTGLFNLTTALTGFSLVRQSTATISGTVSVYGYRK